MEDMKDKKLVAYFVAVVVVLLIAGGIFYWNFIKKDELPSDRKEAQEKKPGNIIENLTAPENGENIQVSEEIVENLTASFQNDAPEQQLPKISKEIINSLTAPE